MSKVQIVGLESLIYYADHLKNLSDDDKNSRFGYTATDYMIDQLSLRIVYDPKRHILFQATNYRNEIMGWGHMAKESDDVWELAVSVEQMFQRQGVGSFLISEMLDWAKDNQISRVYMHCIETNHVIQHLARKHKLVTKDRFQGERTATLEIPPQSWMEKNSMLIKEHGIILGEFAELHRRMANLMFGNTH